MKRILLGVAIFFVAISSVTFAADVGVSVSIGQPGFYGRIDIGDYPYPQPRLIYSQPRVIHRAYIHREPIYLNVPPGHAKNWGKYCNRYNACNERVYFVQNGWYNQEYVPHYQARHRDYIEDRHEENRDSERNKSGKHQNNGHGNKRNH